MPLPEQIAAEMDALDQKKLFPEIFCGKTPDFASGEAGSYSDGTGQPGIPFCPGMLLQKHRWVKSGIL